MPNVNVTVGDQVFSREGTGSFGAVRHVRVHELIVNIEGAGDVAVPASAVKSVHDGKVIVDVQALPTFVRQAIAQAHRGEDPKL
jgi:hypothetical protein